VCVCVCVCMHVCVCVRARVCASKCSRTASGRNSRKVSLLLNLLHTTTTEMTDENSWLSRAHVCRGGYDILKSQLGARFTTYNGDWADFHEFVGNATLKSQSTQSSICSVLPNRTNQLIESLALRLRYKHRYTCLFEQYARLDIIVSNCQKLGTLTLWKPSYRNSSARIEIHA